jgi:hypothetical protein
MSRREAGSRTMTVLAALTAVGLALGVASAHVAIGQHPQDLASAGAPITVWAGTGLDLAALALIAAALRGFGRVSGQASRRPSRFGWRRILVSSVAAVAVVGVGASMARAGWLGVDQVLTPAAPNLPAVAADQADSSAGSRLLSLTKDRDAIGYRLVGAEPGPLVRDLPGPVPAPDPMLAAAVNRVLGSTTSASSTAGTAGTAGATSTAGTATTARDALANLGIGFVGFRGALTEPLVNQLDVTAGMARLGSGQGLTMWRVLPREHAVGSPRLRLADAQGKPLAPVAVTGDHGRTDVALGVGPATPDGSAAGRRLVVAEPPRWSEHALVTFAGRPLEVVSGAGQPTYEVPANAGRLRITLAPTYPGWRWAQLGLLLAVLFLAAPFGSTRSRRVP